VMAGFSVRLFLKNLLFTVLVPGTVAVYVPLAISSDPVAPGLVSKLAQFLSIIPLMAGATVYFWCLWDFATFGRATPAPIDAPKRLVVRGLYHYVRNPMYVGALLVILGWSLYFASARLLLYASSVGVAFHLFVVLYEEPTLRKTFGADYERYASATGRWLPRLRGRQAA